MGVADGLQGSRDPASLPSYPTAPLLLRTGLLPPNRHLCAKQKKTSLPRGQPGHRAQAVFPLYSLLCWVAYPEQNLPHYTS